MPLTVVLLPARNLCEVRVGFRREGGHHLLVVDGFLRADVWGLEESVVDLCPFVRGAFLDQRSVRGFADDSGLFAYRKVYRPTPIFI